MRSRIRSIIRSRIGKGGRFRNQIKHYMKGLKMTEQTFWKMDKVLSYTCMSRWMLYERLKEDFPKPKKLGKRVNVWDPDEVKRWVQRVKNRQCTCIKND